MSQLHSAGAGVLLTTRQPPCVQEIIPGIPGRHSAYVGISVDHAVNMLEARQYQGLDRSARLRTALIEQQQFLAGLLTFAGSAAFDLRTQVWPGTPVPIQTTLLARTWGEDREALVHTAGSIRTQVAAALPSHVGGSPIVDVDDLSRRLDPYQQPVPSATLTKRELTGRPERPDAGVRFYFSVSPFNWIEADWNPFYALLVEANLPLTFSTALFPITVPGWYRQSLARLATWYGRLAREDEVRGGLYYGARRIPPDAFAVDAEHVFADGLRRWATVAFCFRIQITGPQLPSGVVERLCGLISPPDTAVDGIGLRRRSSTGCAAHLAADQTGFELARWNLAAVDCYPMPGQRSPFWNEMDAPPTHLQLLSVLGDATDAACAFRLPVALDGTVPGFRVRRGQFGHSEVYVGEGDTVTLGRLSASSRSLRVPISSLIKHTLVCGSTGSGKSTTVLELLRALWLEHAIPFMVIEPVNAEADDYRKLLGLPGLEQLQVVTIGDERLHPLRFNPFQVPRGVLVAEHVSNLLACFKAAFGLWEPLPSIYLQALEVMYLNADILTSEVASEGARRWPTVIEFSKAMDAATSNLGYAGEIKANIEAASVRRAQQLTTGTCASTFFTDQQLDLDHLLSRPTIIELKSLGSGDDQSLMIALLLNAMTEHYKANWPSVSALRHLTVIEEAHRLLARPRGGGDQAQAQAKEQAAADLANVLAENRKYGEGMIIAEQIPTKLIDDAIKNTNLKIMHRLTAEEDRRQLGRSMGLDDAQERFAARLGVGEALAYSDEFAEAAHIEVDRSIPDDKPEVSPHPTPPFDGCRPCRAKCQYRGAALAMLRDVPFQTRLAQARRDVSGQQPSKPELRANWQTFLDILRNRVKAASALPSEEPAVSDAAFCLFLHALGAEGMRYSSTWPSVVARRLGIEDGARGHE